VVDIDFRVISVAVDSNKFQKTKSWKERSVEHMVTLEPTAQGSSTMWEECTSLWYFLGATIIVKFLVDKNKSSYIKITF
jgi:hypothetical protein